MSDRSKDYYSIQTVKNAFQVLEAVGENNGFTRINQLCERLKMSKGKIFRVLATFESLGYVEQLHKTGAYRLGINAYALGRKFFTKVELVSAARPFLEQLARDLNESVYLAVPVEDSVLLLDMADSGRRVGISPLVGERYPLEGTAMGKVILATQYSTALSPGGMDPAEAAEIRSSRHSRDRNVLDEGVGTVAVPLFGGKNLVSGSLVLIAPDFRLDHRTVQEKILPALSRAGVALSERLGTTCWS